MMTSNLQHLSIVMRHFFSLQTAVCFDVIQRRDPLKSVRVSCLDNQIFEMRFASDVQVTVHRDNFL